MSDIWHDVSEARNRSSRAYLQQRSVAATAMAIALSHSVITQFIGIEQMLDFGLVLSLQYDMNAFGGSSRLSQEAQVKQRSLSFSCTFPST